jgi:hypothetical protein
MVLSLILLALAGAVAFFHYVQGFFSATISAILVAVAAIVAVGYHESLANALFLNSKFVEEGDAISLALLFAVTYIIPRVIFDLLIPGNVRLPVLVDKIGAGVMGLIAGLLSTGILAVAAQTLPFGPDVGFYSRFSVSDKAGQYMGAMTQQDVTMYDLTQSTTLNPDDEEHLWLHQDDLVMGLAYKASDGGSLAGDQPLNEIHPDYLAELFGQRLGIQVGAHRTVPGGASTPISVNGVYTQPQLTLLDGEPAAMRSTTDQPLEAALQPSDPTTQTLLIVRTKISNAKGVADDDQYFRFSPASVRLVMGNSDTGIVDYHPIAILDRRGIAINARIDDFLLADLSGDRTIDLIFMVDNDRAFGPGAKGPPYRLTDGSFLEIKRYGQVQMDDKKVDFGPPINKDKVGILRKPEIAEAINAKEPLPLTGVAPPAKPLPGAAMGDTGLVFQDISSSNKLYAGIDVASTQTNGSLNLTGATGTWQNRQWNHLAVSADKSLDLYQLPGDNLIDQLQYNSEETMVQIHCTLDPSLTGRRSWDWTRNLSKFVLADGEVDEHDYNLDGAWAHFTTTSKKDDVTKDFMIVAFRTTDRSGQLQMPIPQVSKPENVEVWLEFGVSPKPALEELRFNGNAVLENLGFKPLPASRPSGQLPGSE